MNELQILNVDGIECYEKDGTAYLKLETVARGLGFTDKKDGIEYIRWARVEKYLSELNFATSGERPDFIPENIFYRLAMKARNEAAEKFQAKVADEIIPSIRKHGLYATDNVIDQILDNPDFGIELLTKLKEERAARVEAERKNAILMHVNKTYTMTEIAKEIGMKSAIQLNKRKEYPNYLRKCFWKERTFWSDGYFIASIGEVSSDTLKEYIENQGKS